MGIWKFFIIVVAYSLISQYAFMYSSGGWSILLWTIYIGPLLFGGIMLIALIGFTVYQVKKYKKIQPPWKLLYAIIPIELFLVLFNTGDCGDASGSYYFYERILRTNGWEMCKTIADIPWMFMIWELVGVVYIGLLLWFIIKTYRAYYIARKVFAIVLCLFFVLRVPELLFSLTRIVTGIFYIIKFPSLDSLTLYITNLALALIVASPFFTAYGLWKQKYTVYWYTSVALTIIAIYLLYTNQGHAVVSDTLYF